jgi:hypothetical protein
MAIRFYERWQRHLTVPNSPETLVLSFLWCPDRYLAVDGLALVGYSSDYLEYGGIVRDLNALLIRPFLWKLYLILACVCL